jgi:hypothetical protein
MTSSGDEFCRYRLYARLSLICIPACVYILSLNIRPDSKSVVHRPSAIPSLEDIYLVSRRCFDHDSNGMAMNESNFFGSA